MFITGNYSSKFTIMSFWAPALKSSAENSIAKKSLGKSLITQQKICYNWEYAHEKILANNYVSIFILMIFSFKSTVEIEIIYCQHYLLNKRGSRGIFMFGSHCGDKLHCPKLLQTINLVGTVKGLSFNLHRWQ